MRARLRARWLWLHRWVGLSIGLPLAFVALLGSVLIVAKPVDRWMHPTWFEAGGGPAAPHLLEDTRQRLASSWPGAHLTFRPPRQPGETLHVLVRGTWNGTVYIDPATGRERGRRGEHEGFFNLVFELHSALLLEDTGKAVLAAMALAYLLLLSTGLVLWWPSRLGLGLRVQLDRGALRAVFDLHRVGGAVLGGLVAVVMLTGAYMAWRPLSMAVSAIAGASPVVPPPVPRHEGALREPLDRMVQTATALWPGSEAGYVQWTGSDTRPVRVRVRRDEDPHPNGLSSVWLHPVTGDVLAVHAVEALDPGARAYSVIYPLHTGQLGGTAHEAINVASGLLVLGFLGSGGWLWWKRRRATRERRPASPS